MEHNRLRILIGFFIGFISLQSVAQSNTVTAGDIAIGSGGTASFSIGQIDFIELTGSGGYASLGVQQPFEIFVLGSNNFEQILLDAIVYPNPTTLNITLKIQNIKTEGLFLQLIDLNGKIILKQKIDSEKTIVPMERLSSSTYFLSVFDTSKHLKTFKIIKNK